MKLAIMTKNGFFQYLKFWYSQTTLTILLKLSKMVDNNERNHPWKFQVREKSGTYIIFFHRGPIMTKNGLRFYKWGLRCKKSESSGPSDTNQARFENRKSRIKGIKKYRWTNKTLEVETSGPKPRCNSQLLVELYAEIVVS